MRSCTKFKIQMFAQICLYAGRGSLGPLKRDDTLCLRRSSRAERFENRRTHSTQDLSLHTSSFLVDDGAPIVRHETQRNEATRNRQATPLGAVFTIAHVCRSRRRSRTKTIAQRCRRRFSFFLFLRFIMPVSGGDRLVGSTYLSISLFRASERHMPIEIICRCRLRAPRICIRRRLWRKNS